MLDQFLASPAPDSDSDRGAFQLAWRPVGARPLSAALTGRSSPQASPSRLPWPSFELLIDL